MKWNNLKNVNCPKCDNFLSLIKGKYVSSCGFFISKEKFDELVDKMYQNPRGQFNTDNSEALNNLGHDVVKDDFSDSPYLDY